MKIILNHQALYYVLCFWCQHDNLFICFSTTTVTMLFLKSPLILLKENIRMTKEFYYVTELMMLMWNETEQSTTNFLKYIETAYPITEVGKLLLQLVVKFHSTRDW